MSAPPVASAPTEFPHVDVVVVGAGLSGIGAAVRLRQRRPAASVVVLESREDLGGTWDLFRYPGVRSDSDMFTLGYPFKPWRGPESMAGGATILGYLREAAIQFGVVDLVEYSSRVVAADFDSRTSRWTLTVRNPVTGEQRGLTCSFLYSCTGYYDYDRPHDPVLPGREDFAGTLVHPQFWPPDLDHEGRRVVVIGSGATAVTLVPSLLDGAGAAEHVTMLQRTPAWVGSVPGTDALARGLSAVLPERAVHGVVRAKNIATSVAVYQFTRSFPRQARRVFTAMTRRHLGDPAIVAEHFSPPYDPWDQRVGVARDGDFFRAIRSGRAEVVTDRIDRLEPRGVRLASGRMLEADIVVTATGLRMLAFGGMDLSVDGEEVALADLVVWNGAMLTGVPNFAFCMGYVNASWTLRADLSHGLVCSVLAWMDRHDLATVEPPRADGVARRPLMELTAGYVSRSIADFPRQGRTAPWRVRQNYILDRFSTRRADLGSLLSTPVDRGSGQGGSPVWRPDVLGEGYEQRTIELGPDPDGQGRNEAVLVRRAVASGESVRAAALYVHGFADYFFQRELADFFAARGYAFYALDLHKCGRARRPGQHGHHVTDLAWYDAELDRALDVVSAETSVDVTVVAHSTGGLVVSLWLDRARRAGRTLPVNGLVLNSPWLDLQGGAFRRGPLTWAVRAAARVRPFGRIRLAENTVYGDSLHTSGGGEWDYDVQLKPHAGFPVTYGWLNAVRRGHARLHRGLEVGVPTLVLHSDASHFSATRSDRHDRADAVLDVRQIRRWAPRVGNRVTTVEIPGARHDVFLSVPDVRARAYAALGQWLAGGARD